MVASSIVANKTIEAAFSNLINRIRSYNPFVNLERLNAAYNIGKKAHKGQFRASGEAYFSHPIAVGYLLADMHLDTDTIITALLHDTVEDCDITLQDISDQFGNQIANLVDGVTKLSQIENQSPDKRQAENFLKLMPTFYEMESSFLSGIYKRYGDLEGGNIVIFFARDCHLEILRKREKDLNFNLSLDNFWNNHKNIYQEKKKIILVSQQTGLPNETTRRKIISLIKKKHLKKGDRNKLYWEPDFPQKETYLKIIDEEINSLSKFIFEQIKTLSLPLPLSKIEKEISYSWMWKNFFQTASTSLTSGM